MQVISDIQHYFIGGTWARLSVYIFHWGSILQLDIWILLLLSIRREFNFLVFLDGKQLDGMDALTLQLFLLLALINLNSSIILRKYYYIFVT